MVESKNGNGRKRVDENRRTTIKILALAAMLSAVDVTVMDRDVFKSMLKKVGLNDILGEESKFSHPEYGTSLEARARRKEEELKRLCMDAAEIICEDKGEGSTECSLAREKCSKIHVKATPPQKGKKYAMALDVDKCIGCRRCEYACVMENNTPWNMGMDWITVLEVSREGVAELQDAKKDYISAPKPGKVYVPVACQHCEDPPCVHVCPVVATWKDEDGIVLIDYDRCIGCKYCVVACPYGARRFNLVKPKLEPVKLNPNMHIHGNIIRPVHVVEKCTWCVQRTRDGGVPACVEACPVGARVFGDLNDPESPIRQVIDEYGVFVLKPETGTKPKFFYFFGGAQTPRRGEEGGE
ncbi:MAG: 4Fe-4S dicluster domain-containing protein [Desulfurococcales archaeon]|nr:4Fe-4S dicluster domain-containing protein [Desulfurococcales archaeon]